MTFFVSQLTLCIVEELAGGGSVAVAVGVSDMRQMTGDTQHLTPDADKDRPQGRLVLIRFN